MRTAYLSVVATVLLSGCAGAPVGWGGTDEILFQSKDTIKIQWNNVTSSEAAARAKAVAFCKGRDVDLIDASSDSASFGLIRSRTWKCVS